MLRTQMVRFAVTGLVATVLSYGVFVLLFKFAGFAPIIASATGYLAGVGVGYLGNRFWTYGSNSPARREVLAYLLVYLGSLGLTVGLMALLVDLLGFDALLSNVLCIVVTTCVNFLATKFLVFRR